MYYYKSSGTYIASITKIDNATEITEEKYNEVKSIVENRPIAPDGYGYRLTNNLEWELYELPVFEEIATEADYIAALEKLGVYAYA